MAEVVPPKKPQPVCGPPNKSSQTDPNEAGALHTSSVPLRIALRRSGALAPGPWCSCGQTAELQSQQSSKCTRTLPMQSFRLLRIRCGSQSWLRLAFG